MRSLPGRERTLLLGLFCLFSSIQKSNCKYVSGHEDLCIQIGIGDHSLEYNYGNDGFNTRQPGLWTLATKPFDARWLAVLAVYYRSNGPYTYFFMNPDTSPCPWPFAPMCPMTPDYPACTGEVQIQPCVDNKEVRMDMYLVKQEGRVLQGWIYVEIELMDKSHGEIELVYIQFRDETLNAIGEYVTPENFRLNFTEDGCKPSKDYLSTPTQYQVFPCGATGLREAKTSAGILMVKKEHYFKQKELEAQNYLHTKPIKRGVSFFWRTSEYWCSKHAKFQPFAMILTTKNRLLFEKNAGSNSRGVVLRKAPGYWIHPRWYGAADIVFTHGKMDCSELIINSNDGKLTSTAINSWFQKSTPFLRIQDNWSHLKKNTVCVVHPFKGDHKSTFSGRCSALNTREVGLNFFHGCNTNPEGPEFEGVANKSSFVDYHEYHQNKTIERKKFCKKDCTKPSTKEHFQEMTDHKYDNVPKETTTDTPAATSDPKNNSRMLKKVVRLTSGRKYHGITFGFVAFFVAPVSIFYARYYKETFMFSRCYGVHIWYWMHIGGIIATSCLFLSGHAALSPFYSVWGRGIDDYSTLHRLFGYLSLGIFGFLALFGGLRIRARGFGRILTMMLHALLGFAHHYLNLACVALSTWMPMSPTLADCDKRRGMPIGFSLVALLTVIWAGIDFLFHLVLTILHVARDRAIGIWRSWYCPIVPLVRNDQLIDMEGAPLRKILLYVYIALALVVASIVSYVIVTNTIPGHCKYGNTTCEHYFGCTKIAIKYEKWLLNQGFEIPRE